MPAHVESDGQGWCVPNPVQPEENFADKWRTDPERQLNFQRWIKTLKRDLSEARKGLGLDVVSESLSRSFGESPVRKSAASVGRRYRTMREAGGLAMSAGTGTLTSKTTTARPVPAHGFYGAEDPKS